MGIIAIDMDGTLINRHHKISEENITAIKKAKKLGYEVVIATGRAHFDAQQIIDQVGLSLYVISANGATIHSPSGTEIRSVSVSSGETKHIIEWLEKEDYYYELVCNEGIYTPNGGRKILQEEMDDVKGTLSQEEFALIKNGFEKQIGQTGFVFMNHYEEVFQAHQKVYKILVYSFDDSKREKGWEHFAKKQDFTLVYSSPFNFELHHPDASKGQALKYLCKVLNMNMDHSMAIGDSGNDVSMFQVVTDSFAMANANDAVKAEAKFKAAHYDDNGLAKAINQFVDV